MYPLTSFVEKNSFGNWKWEMEQSENVSSVLFRSEASKAGIAIQAGRLHGSAGLNTASSSRASVSLILE